MFRVFRSAWYEKKLRRLPPAEQQRVERFEQELKQQPHSGKPLGYSFFREKKFGGKRLLFLVYTEHAAIFLVTITDKKAQQRDIDLIVKHLDQYRETLREVLKGTTLP